MTCAAPTGLFELMKFGDRFQNEVAERIISELENKIGEGLLTIGAELLWDERSEIRVAALEVMAEYGWLLEEATIIGALGLLNDSEPRVRLAAIAVARETAPECAFHPALQDLICCLEDRCAENREAAFKAIEEMAGSLDSDSYFILGQYLCHEDKGTRDAAHELLSTQGQEELICKYGVA